MKRFALLLFLSGCSVTPYVEGGIGYSFENGIYVLIDEAGVTGYMGAGFRINDNRWYFPSECGVIHRSMIVKKPEIVTDDIRCMKRHYFE